MLPAIVADNINNTSEPSIDDIPPRSLRKRAGNRIKRFRKNYPVLFTVGVLTFAVICAPMLAPVVGIPV